MMFMYWVCIGFYCEIHHKGKKKSPMKDSYSLVMKMSEIPFVFFDGIIQLYFPCFLHYEGHRKSNMFKRVDSRV